MGTPGHGANEPARLEPPALAALLPLRPARRAHVPESPQSPGRAQGVLVSGTELKEAYWRQACVNLEGAAAQIDMFQMATG